MIGSAGIAIALKPQPAERLGIRSILKSKSKSQFPVLKPLSSSITPEDLFDETSRISTKLPIFLSDQLNDFHEFNSLDGRRTIGKSDWSALTHLQKITKKPVDERYLVSQSLLLEKIAMEQAQSALKSSRIMANNVAESIQLGLTLQLQNVMKSLGERVQKETSAHAGVFVGRGLRKTSITVAARLLEAQYISGIATIAAETTRSLITDDSIIANVFQDSLVKKANAVVASFQDSIGDKLSKELKESDSLLRQLKLVSDGFTKDILAKGSYDHFEQLCRLRQHHSPQLQQFAKDVTQLIIFANPSVNPLLALTTIQFVCMTKSFPPQVVKTFSMPELPVFLDPTRKNGIGESAKRVIANSKSEKILIDKLGFLPNQVKPPLKKWMSDAHVALFDRLCAGLKSENEYVRTFAMMTRNNLAGSSPAEAFAFKAFIDTICYSSLN